MNKILKGGAYLYAEKKDCCGCGACAAICSRGAIRMTEDDAGFIYPDIELDKCIGCNACVKLCHYRKPELHRVMNSYAAAVTSEQMLNRAASGGVFSAVASKILENDGIACGAAMRIEGNKAQVEHIAIRCVDDLSRLQGSKYVQSNMQGIYAEIRAALKMGKRVLFSGTPCQVSAVRSMFSAQYGNQLYLMDLICHGVPNIKLLNDELQYEGRKRNVRLTEWRFRDKQYGWGLDGLVVGESQQGVRYVAKLDPKKSTYYQHFLEGTFYRDSCYACPFACGKRAGDVTIGDFWGVEDTNPEILSSNGGTFISERGISCMLVNTEQGRALIEQYGGLLKTQTVEMENIAQRNTQLRHPVSQPQNRKILLRIYNKYGYRALRAVFLFRRGIKLIIQWVKRIIKRVLVLVRIIRK